MADLPALLRERGYRTTAQRVVIHDALQEAGRHLTAEQVLSLVGERLPGVSLPTVYATLDVLEELGLVRRVHTPSALLFDPRPDEHAHALCRSCGRVEDVEAGTDLRKPIAAARRAGYAPDGAEVLVIGLCRDCRSGR
jgi:Fe2+ or Zn2+ uptake regulation protein